MFGQIRPFFTVFAYQGTGFLAKSDLFKQLLHSKVQDFWPYRIYGRIRPFITIAYKVFYGPLSPTDFLSYYQELGTRG